MAYKISTKTKVTSKGDAWGRGRVVQPIYAVAGVNDTGNWGDSPCPSYEVDKEIKDLKKYLEEKGIKSKLTSSNSSNVFMMRRWLVVETDKYEEAKKLTKEYLDKKEESTKYIYDAD